MYFYFVIIMTNSSIYVPCLKYVLYTVVTTHVGANDATFRSENCCWIFGLSCRYCSISSLNRFSLKLMHTQAKAPSIK